jgi:hypothetical protein
VQVTDPAQPVAITITNPTEKDFYVDPEELRRNTKLALWKCLTQRPNNLGKQCGYQTPATYNVFLVRIRGGLLHSTLGTVSMPAEFGASKTTWIAPALSAGDWVGVEFHPALIKQSGCEKWPTDSDWPTQAPRTRNCKNPTINGETPVIAWTWNLR